MDRFVPVGDCLYNTKFIRSIECGESVRAVHFVGGREADIYGAGSKGYAELMRLMERDEPDFWDVK